jgi:eukaryotic-like serine/threonine-protein kinase
LSEPFGLYLLEQRLAAGGMAEVFLARLKDGPDSKRWCVVKRMLPHIASDPHFAAMFLDEAKLAAQLNHPGIAQLYDFGRADEQLYLAMEYVAGATLRGIVKHHARQGSRIDFGLAVEIIARAADALDYAHYALDVNGKPLGLIHRDVSPQNILLSMKGEVKLIDFGVAKAATASQVTAEGVIKGKFPYMSPEQIRGQPLDNRSDLFGLALVLYELLACKRAITGATDVEISQNALALRYQPIEEERPDIPPGLRAILNKALERERKKRYQSAAELAAALRAWLTSYGPAPTGAQLATLLPPMERPPPPPLDLTAQARPNLPPPPPSFWDTPAPAPVTAMDPSNRPTAMVDDSDVRKLLADREPLKPTGLAPKVSPAPTPQPAPPALPPLPPPVPPAALRADEGPGSGSASKIRQAVRAATLPWILSAIVLAAGMVVLLVALSSDSRRAPVAAPQPRPADPVATGGSSAPTVDPAPTPAPAAEGKPAVLQLSAAPVASVTVDGKPRGRTPLEVSLAPGEHTVVFEDPTSGLRQTRKVTLVAGETKAEAWKRGFLSVRASPWGEVFIDGESVGVTPLPPIELTAGKHKLRVVNSETKRENAREIEVFPGAEVVVKVDLR